MTKKSTPDWEAIERAYRAGSVSVRAIADEHQTKEGTIRSRAKTHGWMRDLTEQVRSATRQKISRTVSRTDFTQPDVREDAQIIDDTSSKRAGIVLGQISRLEYWEGITKKLADSLNKTNVTEDNQAEFARSLNAGVDAELKLIKAQRQAFGIDDNGGEEESFAQRMERLMGDQ